MFCRMIKVADNAEYEKEFKLMEEKASDLISRKIYSSLHQSAQMLHVISKVLTDSSKILSAGAFEDVPTEVLSNLGVNIVAIDPVLNTDLHFYRMHNLEKRFDVIFSTSVIEHVEEDEQFITDMAEMLAPGGFCFITCDFKPGYKEGDPLPATCVRLYTEEHLKYLTSLLANYKCKLTRRPEWNITEDELDFEWDNVKYCFMGMSFRKEE